MKDRCREALMAVRATELGRQRNDRSGWFSARPLLSGSLKKQTPSRPFTFLAAHLRHALFD